MIQHLYIQNYALIEELELELSSGLSVITGETGAGKSILLGALGLITGQRADVKALLDPEKKCVVEVQFRLEDYPELPAFFASMDMEYAPETIVRREVHPQGKSRGFVNDSPVSMDQLKALGQQLLDIHSQTDHWWISHPDFSLELVDGLAQTQTQCLDYQKAYKNYIQASKSLKQIQEWLLQDRQAEDYLRFQWQELEGVSWKAGEWQVLEQQLEALSHAEQIQEKLGLLAQGLSLGEPSALDILKQSLNLSLALKKFGPQYEAWSSRLEAIWIEIKELSREVEAANDPAGLPSGDLDYLQARMDQLQRLMQKHQVRDLEGLQEKKDALKSQLNAWEQGEEKLAGAQTEQAAALALVMELGNALSTKRRLVLNDLNAQLAQHLQRLGIPNAQVVFEMESKEAGPNGLDKIHCLFSANKGQNLKPLKMVASGGELSRLMLSIKAVLAEKTAMPSLIMDEIDTGVSGEVGIQMGKMFKKMSQNHQVICITHLPQIAAAGDAHYHVYKDHAGTRSLSKIKVLSPSERVNELAQMIGGHGADSQLKESVKQLFQRYAE